MERATREVWAKRVERWTESELTAKEFAEELGINAHSLGWWKWRLGAEAAGRRVDPPRTRRTQRRAPSKSAPKSKPTSAMTFVELPSATPSEALEVVLPTTIRIRVPHGFDDATLRRLLDVLEQRR